MTIHIVYPEYEGSHAAPWTIGNALRKSLSKFDEVRFYPWDWYNEDTGHKIEPQDLIIGHPNLSADCSFEKLIQDDCIGKAIICPWNGDGEWTRRLAFFEEKIQKRFYITGPNHQVFDCEKLNMFVDRSVFPTIKESFNPPGSRNFLYVGCTLPIKGVSWLAMLAERTGYHFGHIGPGMIGGGVKSHGVADLSRPENQKQICEVYDFIISTGITDANPTSLIEGGSLGLIGISTRGCGWNWTVQLSGNYALDDCNKINELQWIRENYLFAMQRDNIKRISEEFTEENFVKPIEAWVRESLAKR